MGRIIRLGFFVCMLLTAPLHADGIRSWVGAGGTVHFGDKSVAPQDSQPVKLSPGSVVKMAPVPSRSAESAPSTSAPGARAHHCTPVLRDYVDPKTGMHSARATGRCEDGDVAASDEPRYDWRPCDGPVCMRLPTPPLPPEQELLPPSSGRSMPAMGGTPLIPYR